MNNENEETPRTRIPRGHGPGASFEKPKNFKEALLKLKKYLSKFLNILYCWEYIWTNRCL